MFFIHSAETHPWKNLLLYLSLFQRKIFSSLLFIVPSQPRRFPEYLRIFEIHGRSQILRSFSLVKSDYQRVTLFLILGLGNHSIPKCHHQIIRGKINIKIPLHPLPRSQIEGSNWCHMKQYVSFPSYKTLITTFAVEAVPCGTLYHLFKWPRK